MKSQQITTTKTKKIILINVFLGVTIASSIAIAAAGLWVIINPSSIQVSKPMKKVIKSEELEIYGFIVRLSDDPTALYQKSLEKETKDDKEVIEKEVIAYKEELVEQHKATKEELKNLVPKAKIIREYYVAFNGFAVVDITEDQCSQLEKLGYIEEWFPNRIVKAMLDDSVPRINADDVWSLGYTGKGTTIAIIDTGVDSTHSDVDKVIDEHCYCSYGGPCCPNMKYEQHGLGAGRDDNGHGTHVAGIAASDGDASGGVLKGVAPDADLVAIKALNEDGYGLGSDIIAGIERAADPDGNGNTSDHYDVINLSLGGAGDPDDSRSQAVDNAVDAGVVVTVAAGNSGYNMGIRYFTIESPGCARKAITVGAISTRDSVWVGSSRGPTMLRTVKPDVLAPGLWICSSRLDNKYPESECYDDEHVELKGTSMAAPHVAGAVALIKEAHSDWSPGEIKMALRNTAYDIEESILAQGWGLIDVLAAVQSEKLPVAQLNTSGLYFRGEKIDIMGTAAGENFKEYTLYYGESWDPQQLNESVEICSSATQVEDGVLCSNFDSSVLSQGDYTLWLVVDSEKLTAADDRSIIYVGDSIQSFIDNVPDGAIIEIPPGNYYGHIEFRENQYGQAVVTLVSTDGPEVTSVIGTDREMGGKPVVSFTNGRNAVLDGFAIEGGYKELMGGAGIDISSGSSPTIKNCIIQHNEGAGASIVDIRDNLSRPTIKNCIIQNNQASAGVVNMMRDSAPSIINTVIGWNEGVGVIIDDELYSLNLAHTSVINNSFGILSYASSSSFNNVKNSIIWGNSDAAIEGRVSVWYSDVQGGWPGGRGNIDADPKFRENDYHLTTGSPCIDKADDYYGENIDIEYDLRPAMGGYDMGADECPAGICVKKHQEEEMQVDK